MNRIRNTRNTENSLRKVGVKIVRRGEGSIFDCTHLRGPRQHTLTGIKTSARSILNFLDLRTLFPDDGTIERTANIQDTLGIARDTFRDHHTCAAFLTDLVDVGTTLTDDD